MVGKRETGASGERIAGEYLKMSGYRILETNYRSGHLEIDLIAEREDCLVFIEVKTRRGDAFGEALESVSWAKLGNIRKAARIYLSNTRRRIGYGEYRLDLIAIDLDTRGDRLVLRHVKGIA